MSECLEGLTLPKNIEGQTRDSEQPQQGHCRWHVTFPSLMFCKWTIHILLYCFAHERYHVQVYLCLSCAGILVPASPMQWPDVFPQQQNAKGSLHNIDFGVFWASWGGSAKELGSGNRFRVTGFAVPWISSRNRLHVSMVPTGFAVPRFRVQFSGNRVPDPRHRQGSGFRRLRARGFEGFRVRWVPTG